MEPTQDNYPVFEANQVLSNTHLNQVFNYLDEQERLTRANLIGIGIVCGLEISLNVTANTSTINISKGCGVTSEGYLVVQPKKVNLVSYREYTLPSKLDYPQFKDLHNPLWELFPAGEPDTKSLAEPQNFLSDKAVLLFLELKKEELRNCSSNNCDDRGSAVTVTVRRLLISRIDLDKIIAEASKLNSGLSSTELADAFKSKLALEDIRLPRYILSQANPSTSLNILRTFQTIFLTDNLLERTSVALAKAYKAFKPVLQDISSKEYFIEVFRKNFDFLAKEPERPEQVRFLQYYYDFFGDLLKAYDEFRWKGVDLLCACCPPDGLFPRHLILGVVDPSSVNNSMVYRQQFLPSAVINGCEEQKKELKQLFQRLVEMITSFTNKPIELKKGIDSKIDEQIRITPSKLGDVPLSDKAIPYYYLQEGKPPLYQLWNFDKTRRHRADQNLSYRYDEYKPKAPEFVRNALNYDLESYNFLRIEGHLGKDYKSVLETLLSLKNTNCLPIEIIALRTGRSDKSSEVNLSEESCLFQDLEALYVAQREELLSTLCEGVRYLYDISIESDEFMGGIPKLPLLHKYAPGYLYKTGTVGAWCENHLELIQKFPYVDAGQNKKDEYYLKLIDRYYTQLLKLDYEIPEKYFAHLLTISHFAKLFEILPVSLVELGFADFENKYQSLIGLIRYFRSDAVNNISKEFQQFIPQEDLIDHFDQVLFACKLEPVKAIHEEYVDRIEEIKKKQFLSFFLQKNPGITHKAGVPIGGTFIIVYHDNSGLVKTETEKEAAKIYFETLKGIDDGTVIADFFLPYLCCSDCAPVQFVLPVPPLGLAIKLACTNLNGLAKVVITPKGGMAPFFFQLDSQPFKELQDELVLSVGPHTLVIRDSAGAESALQSFTVPGALTIGAENYVDKVLEKTYQVSFNISGGVAPYKAESGTVAGTTYTSAPVRSGEAISVTVIDSAGCEVTKEFKHTVEDPCKLPCKGVALRRGYRFSLPSSNKNLILNELRFTFEFPQGKKVDLTQEVAAILQKLTGEAGFNESFAQQINEFIAKATGSSDCLIFNFSPAVSAPQVGLGTWEIEYFECLKFEFHITWTYASVTLLLVPTTSITINPDGSTIKGVKGGSVLFDLSIPAFDTKKIDKCDPNRPIEDLCKQLDLELEITKKVASNSVTLDVTPSGSETPVAWLWEVQDGIPPMSNNQQQDFTFTQLEPATKDILLTAFTKRGCRVIASDVFVVPVPQLSLDVQLGCTNPEEKVAEVTLTVQGGVAPFTYQLDNQPFKELIGQLALSAGPHTLVIRDSAGTESALQKFTVPGALTMEAENYIDDVSANTYQVSFNISGGVPPYKVESGTVTGSAFTSAPVASDAAISVTLIDSVGCKVTKDFKHTVESPCTLPCDGIALRRGYRFWLPEPDLEQKKLFRSYGAEVPTFTLEFPQGSFIDLSGEISSIIKALPEELNKQFNKVVQAWLARINKLIIEKTGSEDWLRFEYSKLPDEPMGTLWIEYFECLKFEFNIQSFFQRPENSEQLDMVYSPQETSIRNLEIRIPAFDGIEIKKCDPQHPSNNLCENVDMKLIISNKSEGETVSLDFAADGQDKPVAWLWEVQDGIPAMCDKQQQTFKFAQLEPTTKNISLTAYTERGCRVIARDKIELG